MPLTKIQSLGITDGTIVNADINASAAIAGTKLGAGSVLQVITATDSTQRSTTSTSFVTGSNTLSVSITPSSASNKIFVIANSTISSSTASGQCYTTIFRDSTNLGEANGIGSGATSSNSSMCSTILDSPSTTSAITYQVYFRSDDVAKTASINKTVKASITAFEIAG
jgi:hypothetical protein